MQRAWRESSHQSIPLWLRLGLPIALIIALCVGFIGFLNYFNYEKTYRHLIVSRVMVIGGDLRQAVEVGLNFGLAPRSNSQLDPAMSAAKDSSEGLDFVVLIDQAGEWIGGAGTAPRSHDWRARLAAIGKETSWQSGDQETYQVGLPYRNSFGVAVGAVVLGYNKRAMDQATASMRRTLTLDWLKISALFSLAAFTGVWLLTRRLEADLDQVKSALDHGSDQPPVELRLTVLGPEIESGVPELVRQRQKAQRALVALGSEP